MISIAHAQDVLPAAAGNNIMAFLPIILVFIVFYFLVLRPQNKRMTEHTKLLTTLRRGDKILTTGGLHAIIYKVHDDVLDIQLAEGVVTQLEKQSVVSVLIRATEKSEKTESKKDKKTKK